MHRLRQHVRRTSEQPAAAIRRVVVSDLAGPGWLRIVRGSIALTHLSFGQANDYAKNAGQPVHSDFSEHNDPLDLAHAGAEVWPVGDPVHPVTAAFVLSPRNRPVHIRADFQVTGSNANARRFYVWAHMHGVERVAPTLVTLDPDGRAQVDLAVKNLPLDCVRTIAEDWTWDISETSDGDSPEHPRHWTFHAVMPVKIYVTAAPAVNLLACETFYHLACQREGAREQEQARGDVWKNFCDPPCLGSNVAPGVPGATANTRALTNARHQPLTMWRTSRPSLNDFEYTSRSGQTLAIQGDASCNGWANLLSECFAIHGIRSDIKLLEVDRELLEVEVPSFRIPIASGDTVHLSQVGMIISRCQFAPAGSLKPDVEVSAKEIKHPCDFTWKLNVPEDIKSIVWESTDVTRISQPGHLAAGSHSTGIFSNHVVVLVEPLTPGAPQLWFDPCYSLGGYSTLLEYQHALLGDGRSEPTGGLFAVVGCVVEKQINKGVEQVTRIPHGHYGARPAPSTLCLKPKDVKRI